MNNGRLIEVGNEALFHQVLALLQEGHSVTMRLKGTSMRPFLEDGRDKGVLESLNREPRRGDVVMAEVSEGRYVFHRIIGIRGDMITLLGDGNLQEEHCRRGDIKALLTAFYRKGREKPDLASGLKWRTYSWLWMRLRPLRRYMLFLHRHLFISSGKGAAE